MLAKFATRKANSNELYRCACYYYIDGADILIKYALGCVAQGFTED